MEDITNEEILLQNKKLFGFICSDDLYVAYMVFTMFVYNLSDILAAVSVYRKVDSGELVLPNIVAPYIETMQSAAEHDLISQIAALFDPARTKNNENISIHLLREKCLEESLLFPGGAKDDLIHDIDGLISFYEGTSIKTIRNKTLSHHDMKQAVSSRVLSIYLETEEEIVLRLQKITTKLSNKISICGETGYSPQKELERICSDALAAIAKAE